MQPYTSKAKAACGKSNHIFETHFHSDFVSGHVALSDKTGAPIIYGPNAYPTLNLVQQRIGKNLSWVV